MKMNTSKKVHYDSGPNMTPLVDVVMVILIFLMLTGSFGVSEKYLVSNMPVKQKGAGNVKDPKTIPDEDFHIRVDTAGSGFKVQAGQITESNPDYLSQRLAKLREALIKDTPNDRIQVVISPGRQVKYEHLIQVYDAALQAGFTKVAFSQSHD